ncbi:MAG: hypothetical protein HW421_2729 [Ignavibacteria bacterium]|nr:hypothetical protein [Ignavibacteria bacterium]
MKNKHIHRTFAVLAFVLGFVTYSMTVQPSVPFWDCGEFSAAAIWQQVPHPPGSPLFLMVGKVFHLLIPFGDAGWRVNMVSVTVSAVSIMLLYMIGVMLLMNFFKKPDMSFSEEFAVIAAAFIGAAAYNFSDTFWFNAVESEVYASSSIFCSIIIYLMLRWNEEADNKGHERYLMLIAYLIGLSSGVHLLAVLTIFSVTTLVYFRKYQFTWSSFFITGVVGCLIFFIIYPGIVKWVPTMLAGNLPFKNKCREYIYQSPMVRILLVGGIIGVCFAFYYSWKKKKELMSLIFSSLILILLGYTTYTQVLIRSNSNPPLNENEPKDLTKLTSYLGREQYGEAPNWPRRYQHDDHYYTDHYTEKNDKGEYRYGPWYAPDREEAICKNGGSIYVPTFKRTDIGGELAYMFKYQIDHMFLRYFFWNFVGRKSDNQDAEAAWFDRFDVDRLNFGSGYAYLFPIRFYALPFLLGFLGLFFHFRRDSRMAFVFFVMFLLMGLLATLAQNQQDPQPRERDYFYAGAFYIYAIWISFGVFAIFEMINKEKIKMAVVVPVFLLALLAAPINMALGGWKLHSRAGNFIPFDYSYNILQSTEKDAIIFTNGDNDTFPLWFLQDVEGVRRDVRIVNLSLGNTLWYVDQLKNRSPWGAMKLPLTFADDSLQVDENDPKALKYDFIEAQNVVIPVDRDILRKYTNDPAIINDGNARFTFSTKDYGEREGKKLQLFMIRDFLILDILKQVKWTRPVYYSITVGPDAFCGLESFFRYEGMAMRVCPVQQKSSTEMPIDPKIMEQCLLGADNSDNYSTGPKYGFKFRNLNNPGVYYDEVHRRLTRTYHTLFLTYTTHLLQEENNKKKAEAVLDSMLSYISPVQFPIGFEYLERIAKLYRDCGALDKAKKYASKGIATCKQVMDNPQLMPGMDEYEVMGRYYGPYRASSSLYEILGDYNSARETLKKLYDKAQGAFNQVQNNQEYQEVAQRLQQNIADLVVNIETLTIDEVKLKNGKEKALDTTQKIIKKYESDNNPLSQFTARMLQKKILELGGQLPEQMMQLPQ